MAFRKTTTAAQGDKSTVIKCSVFNSLAGRGYTVNKGIKVVSNGVETKVANYGEDSALCLFQRKPNVKVGLSHAATLSAVALTNTISRPRTERARMDLRRPYPIRPRFQISSRLVSGAGDIKITKDGNVLLHEMQIQHPTASLIARASTAIDDQTGDGTTSTVLLIGELLKQADNYLADGLHPRLITEGFEIARALTLETLENFKVTPAERISRDVMLKIAATSLNTKLNTRIAGMLTEIVVEAMLAISENGNREPDLFMVEVMEMEHKMEADTQLVKGIVLDHGGRHPDMPKKVENAFILTCNVSLEYEKTEVNAGFFYKSAEERNKMVTAEREFIDKRVKKIIALKHQVCPEGSGKNFVVINQKGIDPDSLDHFAREGILALRRAKRRNMERLPLACGGQAVNSVDELTPEVLGYAGVIYEHVLGDNKFTFIEEVKDPKSVTVLLKGAAKHERTQMKDALRDGLRAIKNYMDDACYVPGAGAFEVAACAALRKKRETVKGRPRLGVQAFADALLIIPKTLAQNAGFDAQDTIVKLEGEFSALGGQVPVGIDLDSGETMNPLDTGVLDNYTVQKQMINTATVIASNLLLVDEVMRAGLSSLKG
ncbi:unnamed protein product [Cyprideis torosa]|uniref:Chaperonin n=1 Tax=Cyprideis torosa TaxID=163714 RepID=A0A7R8ZJJ7_9CRUS|nr:unnamed protein product [Cyprideis torosa]CAG0887175.1 unnamed protein product [Cyprideis torosa]